MTVPPPRGGSKSWLPAAPGYYTLRLRAVPTVADPGDARPIEARIDEAFAVFTDEVVEQTYDVQVGNVAAARVTPRQPLSTSPRTAQVQGITAQAVPSTGGLNYTVYYGNLHSQTNHSDGGGDLATCTGAQAPQTGKYGPADAYTMMQNQAHGDFLLTSEHNHMFDGSDSTNTSANPTTAINLFHSGLTAAANYRTAHPSFLALYGLEWGVISNGGHLNILNVDQLTEWETNSSGQLIGEVNTPKSDYAALYSTMKAHGWIGMFNHPATSGQFIVGGTALGYDANGAQVMMLAEVLNSSAFSTNTTETETGRSSYQSAWNILLERGYKVAPASDQDNHCANWGLSFTNRTGVLLPSGTVLNPTNFYDAIRARRVFATEDRTGQLVLSANGHVMGESFSNSGTLTLTANFASTSGQTAQRVQFFQGVPGSNGTVTQLYEGSDTTTITPASGEHFYYAQVTEANGLRLWSAPVWVTQGTGGGGGDTQLPTASASESGTSGTITLSATASDNVGVTKVEFYVDGALKGSDATSPYSMTLDSTTLSNGSHTLVAKAYDAAGNVGSSSSVAFSVSNAVIETELVQNGGFESGASYWTATSGAVTNSSTYVAHAGTYKMWLDGYGTTTTEYGYQTISIPAGTTTATLTFWVRVDSAETTTSSAYDTLKVQLRNSSNTVLTTLATYSNLNKGSSYVQKTFDVSAYRGQTVRVYFEGSEDSSLATSFLLDDVSLRAK
ncbi:Ig-like domain-containing protein [Cognatilysobacter lacus]|uniref:Carbohydrate-binding protein CenC n=1 Tax=Cognatilysobacter lacus TaxID=1643323 RepID=A0A5D8Z1D3_9GAMM|nr:Ig-like domain-containing protein [Lysobacter lacus]TZF87883.1 carbohydrate-binding protein CenC [Lysobacter lacus]